MLYEPTPHLPHRPSPAVLFVGRQNSGKTTLLEKVIACLSNRGLDVATLKHHGHPNFEIDVPGKDSWRHRQAGAQSTCVLSSSRMALTRNLDSEMSCFDALELMPDYDLVLVEGFRGVGLPAIELFRAENPKDQAAATAMLQRLESAKVQKVGHSLPNEGHKRNPDAPELPVALVTNMPDLANAAAEAQIPTFGFEDVDRICTFVQSRYARAPFTIAIQAGGESKRMGQSKARTEFLGRPLIEHMLDVVTGFAEELIVTTNEADKLAYLERLHPGIRLVPDIANERGALPGLLTAVHHSSNDIVGVVACDMIAFPTQMLAREALTLQATCADAVIPCTDGYWEPFAGVYRKSACEPTLQELVGSGVKRMRGLIDNINCQPFSAKSWQRRGMIDPFANVNTPQELAQAEVLYRVYR